MSEMISNNKQKQKIKEIVLSLQDESQAKQAAAEFHSILKNISPDEIAAVEQELIEEGIPIENMQKLCELHVQVFEGALKNSKKVKTVPGHPVHSFRMENKTLKKELKLFLKMLKATLLSGSTDASLDQLDILSQVNFHYLRKENQLFPYLEKVGFSAPSKVMWAKHDEIRLLLKKIRIQLAEHQLIHLKKEAKELKRLMKQMIFMEERILFPTAIRKLPDAQWIEIRKGEGEIGYSWIKPGNLWDPSVVNASNIAKGDFNTSGVGSVESANGLSGESNQNKADLNSLVNLDTGALNTQQLNLMLKTLPLDITFVDENDEVRYYSDSKERLFPRSPGIIGRDVQNCHPPKSVHVVMDIVKAFKEKSKTKAQFWIKMGDKLAFIQYFPVYDEKGDYKGTVELSMDAAPIQKLEGERRILDWE